MARTSDWGRNHRPQRVRSIQLTRRSSLIPGAQAPVLFADLNSTCLTLSAKCPNTTANVVAVCRAILDQLGPPQEDYLALALRVFSEFKKVKQGLVTAHSFRMVSSVDSINNTATT